MSLKKAKWASAVVLFVLLQIILKCYKSIVGVGDFVLLLQLCLARSLPKTNVFFWFTSFGFLFSYLHTLN